MTREITVLLPDRLVDWLEEQNAAGAGSQATLVTKALMKYQREASALRDAEIYQWRGGYPDLEGMHENREFPSID